MVTDSGLFDSDMPKAKMERCLKLRDQGVEELVIREGTVNQQMGRDAGQDPVKEVRDVHRPPWVYRS